MPAGNVDPYPATLHHYLPANVCAASKAHEQALDRLVAAQGEEHARRAEAEVAGIADKRAARAAVEQGKPMPPATAPAALDALEAARRTVEAAEAIAVEAQNTFVRTQAGETDQTVAAVSERQAQIRTLLNARLDEIAHGVSELAALGHLLDELRGGAMRSRSYPSFAPVRRVGRRPRDFGEEAVQGLRAQIAQHAPEHNTILTAGEAA